MTGFADRFSASQRAALAALGYAVLERSTATRSDRASQTDCGSGASRDRQTPCGSGASREQRTPCGSGVSRDRRSSEDATFPQAGSRLTPLPQGHAAASHETGPSAVLIEDMDGSGLARGVLAAAIAAAGESRVSRRGEQLRVALGGDGDAWRLSLQRLRRSPRDKAALWRALRRLGRSTQ